LQYIYLDYVYLTTPVMKQLPELLFASVMISYTWTRWESLGFFCASSSICISCWLAQCDCCL